MPSLRRAILQTLAYSDYFGFPLTRSELHRRLIGVGCTLSDLTRELSQMEQLTRLASTNHYWHLPERSYLVHERLRRRQLSAPLLAQAELSAARLGRMPGVLAVYLTGSLALSNTDGSGDIDLLVVTANGRLWTTRLLLTLFTSFLGLRRTPTSTANSGKLCLNLYLTPNSFSLPESRRSLYTAFELVQSRPLYDPHGTHSSLLLANPWVRDFLPNYPYPVSSSFVSSSAPQSPLAFRTLEKILFWLQYRYMSRRRTREFITPEAAFFHPLDPGAGVLSRLALK